MNLDELQWKLQGLAKDKAIVTKLGIIGIMFVAFLFILAMLGNDKRNAGDENDGIGPRVVRVSSTNLDGQYTTNQNLEFVVEFDEEIYIGSEGEPELKLDFDGMEKRATYVKGDSNTSLNFRYKIAKGDMSEKLNYTSEDALEPNGMVIYDKFQNEGGLVLPLTESENSLAGTKNIRVNTDEPYPIVTEFQKTKELKEYTITFTKKVSGFTDDDIDIYNGIKSNFTEIEQGRIFKLEVSKATQAEQSIMIRKDICTDDVTGVFNSGAITIPRNFFYVGGTKESGFVVSDSALDLNINFKAKGAVTDMVSGVMGNSYVWVPIDYINDHTGTYEVSSSRNVVTNSSFGRREYNSWGEYEEYKEKLPSELVTSVNKYGGYYVARYEGIVGSDGRMGSKISIRNDAHYAGKISVKDKDSRKVLYNYLNASSASSAISKTYSKAAGVVPHLPYAAEYDTLMKWLEESGADVNEDSTTWGNYINSYIPQSKESNIQIILETGTDEYRMQKNIYDIAGNLWEWTQEQGSDGNVVRGGCYSSRGSDKPAAYRTCLGSSAQTIQCGGRIFFYIK